VAQKKHHFSAHGPLSNRPFPLDNSAGSKKAYAMSRLKYSLSLAFLMAAIPSCGGHHHHGRCPRMGGVEEGLHVSGQGEVRAAPDVARATVCVEVRASTSDEATERLAQHMGVVLTALRNHGVAVKDLQ